MKIMSVVGARPQFVKLFPITRAIPKGMDHQIVHTGQHYDESLSQAFFDELNIPRPFVNLGVGSGTHAEQTAKMMIGLEAAFTETKPDVVLAYGDTNSTVAAALVASKLHIPLVHLEAGLRSFNRVMPEELNRIVTDHLSYLLLAPSNSAIQNLIKEGLGEKSVNIGDVMVDSTLLAKKMINDKQSHYTNQRGKYVFCTIHRAENTNNPERLRMLIQKISQSTLSVVFAAHPRVLNKCKEAKINLDSFGIEVINPQSYLSTINLISQAQGVITDSGGMQKEAYILGVPALTLRSETEWIETLQGSWNLLDPNGEFISSEWFNIEKEGKRNFLGEGNASKKAIEVIQDLLVRRTHKNS